MRTDGLRACHQKAGCCCEKGRKDLVCVADGGTGHADPWIIYTFPSRFRSAPPCPQCVYIPPTLTSVQILSSRPLLATSLTLWKVPQIIQSYKKNFVWSHRKVTQQGVFLGHGELDGRSLFYGIQVDSRVTVLLFKFPVSDIHSTTRCCSNFIILKQSFYYFSLWMCQLIPSPNSSQMYF